MRQQFSHLSSISDSEMIFEINWSADASGSEISRVSSETASDTPVPQNKFLCTKALHLQRIHDPTSSPND